MRSQIFRQVARKIRSQAWCLARFFDAENGADFRQRYPEFKWFLVLSPKRRCAN